MMLKVLDVDGAVRKVSGGWVATGQPWDYDAERYARVAAERHREQQAMLSYLRTPGAGWSTCASSWTTPRPSRAAGATTAPAAVARGSLGGRGRAGPGPAAPPGHRHQPAPDVAAGHETARRGRDGQDRRRSRRRTPAGRSAASPASAGAPGSAPCLDNPADPGADDPVPGDLVAALVQVLAAWDWEQRPAGVVTLPSHTRPQLIASLGERIAEIGRLPLLGSLTYAGSGPRASAQQFNSPQRLQAVWRELQLPGPLAGAVASLGGPVLVIDDRIESGWTMTVAARLLREAGAPRVLPLVLAVNAG